MQQVQARAQMVQVERYGRELLGGVAEHVVQACRARARVCVCVRVFVHVCVNMRLCMCTCLCVRASTNTRANTHARTCELLERVLVQKARQLSHPLRAVVNECSLESGAVDADEVDRLAHVLCVCVSPVCVCV